MNATVGETATEDGDQEDLSTGAIVGIRIGGAVVLCALLGVAGYYLGNNGVKESDKNQAGNGENTNEQHSSKQPDQTVVSDHDEEEKN